MDRKAIKNKFCGGINRVDAFLRKLVFLFPPIIVCIAMLYTYRSNGLYPFGTKTISWCDMDQQVVPLLIDFKDILSGKSGFFFSMKNAGGMNFFGVFFFFLSSPFSFLVAFVDKAEIISFANVLVLLKMCTIACTSSLYFRKKYPNAPLLNVALSVLYAYSGYTMLYYQNVIWLDVVYLFPLLLLGLERMKEGKKTLFVCSLAACVVVNYYLSYMVVVFLLLYVGLWLWLSKERAFAQDVTIACLLAAMLSAVVWLPSLVQYFSSGRTTSILDNLRSSSVFTSFETTLPTVFSILFLFPFAFCAKKEDKDNLLRRLLFVLTLLPIVFEPINKMWQTGSYMSFPTRYGFITIFLCLTLAADTLCPAPADLGEEKQLSWREKIRANWKKNLPMYALSLVSLLLAVFYLRFSRAYTAEHVETMDQYSHSLWGNEASLEALLKLYAVAALVGVVWFILYRYRLVKTVLLWVCVAVMVCSELYVAPMTYMLTPSHEVDWHQDVMELADKIDDDGFYRVKTDKSYSGRDFDVNLMASLGYNGLGHYTSLTSQKYMTAIKQFGYTSYWMEVGNSGGTLLTDALLSVKYRIQRKNGEDGSVYKGNYFQIDELAYTLPLGVVARTDIIAREASSDYTRRAELQSTLYADFFSGEAVRSYGLSEATYNNLEVREENGKYVLTPKGTGSIVFNLPIGSATAIYFNAFDENTNALNQKINKKFKVSSPQVTESEYPKQRENGLLYLGEYARASRGETVSVTVTVKETVTVRDVGVVTIENDLLENEVKTAKTIGLQEDKNALYGNYVAEGGECVFLSVAYDEGMRLKINGKKAQLYEVYDGFTAFYLQAGNNEIELSFTPSGFGAGLAITLIGLCGCAALAAICIWKRSLPTLPKVGKDVLYWCWIAAGAAALLLVYVCPLLLCAMG